MLAHEGEEVRVVMVVRAAQAGVVLGWVGIGLGLAVCLLIVIGLAFFSISSSTITIGTPVVVPILP